MGLVNLWRITRFYERLTAARRQPDTLREPATWLALYRAAWAVEEIRIMLSGYKTYLIAAATAALTLAHTFGYIDAETYQKLLALLGAGGLATVRAAISKTTNGK